MTMKSMCIIRYTYTYTMFDKLTEKLALRPTMLTYGMIGMTTIILAALTVFDSADAGEEEPSYVSQLFGDQDKINQDKEETGLISSMFSGDTNETDNATTTISGGKRKKTHKKRNKCNKANRKTRHHK